MSIYNENPESSIANQFFFMREVLSVEDWHLENKHFIQSGTLKEKAENTIDAFLKWKKKKFEPFQIHARSTLKCQSSFTRVRSNFSRLWAEIKLTHLFTQAWSFPSNTQGLTLTVVPIKAAATGENGNLSSCLPLWFLLYMVWSSVTNNLRSDTNNSQQGFRLDSKSTDSTIHYLQDCAEGSHKENVMEFSLDTERTDDGKEVRTGLRPDQVCLGRYGCKQRKRYLRPK